MKKEKLGNIVSFQRGYDLTHGQMSGGNIPVVGSSEIIGWHNIAKCVAPTLLIGRSGTVGRPQFYDCAVWPHNTTLFVTDFHGNNPKYCYYLLRNLNLEDYANSSGVPTLNRNFIEPLQVKYHEKGEQDRIANILSVLDDKISTNNKIIETSEKLMREIYDYWFLQFDFPDENGRPYKSSGGKMIYDENINRKIPDGWRSTKLKGLYKIERGISYSSKDIESSSGTPMINLACVDISRNYRDGGIKLYDGKFSSANVAKANDLIIACTDLTRNADIVGSPILVPDDGREYVFSMDMAKISSFSEELDNMYLYATLRTDYYHSFIKYWASGTNVLHLNLSGLDWYPVWLPPIKLQKIFAEIVRNINASSGLLRKENASLASLRDWLLPMLMGGQIKIGD